MIEIEYCIGEIKTSMFVVEKHLFYLVTEAWIKAGDLNVDDKILTCSGTVAGIVHINKIVGPYNCRNLKISHNHHYFVTTERALGNDKNCDRAPINPLELIPYQLANRPSNFPNGKPTGDHSGPWVAARYLNSDSKSDVIGWGRANDTMCAEDAAVSNLRYKLGDTIGLHRGNVEISHAYVRKYTRKGRLVNKMSPCIHCRKNYGSALNDGTMGTSHLHKDGRGYLPTGELDNLAAG